MTKTETQAQAETAAADLLERLRACAAGKIEFATLTQLDCLGVLDWKRALSRKGTGRKRVHASNAARYKAAYERRKKEKKT